MTTAVVGLVLKTQFASTQISWNLLGLFPEGRRWYVGITSGAVESQVGELAQQLCVWMRWEGTGQRACKKLMASELSKSVLGKKGKSIIEMNCALVRQVDGQRQHGETLGTRRQHTVWLSPWRHLYLLRTAVSAQNWFYVCNILHIFPMFFSWRGTVVTPYPLQRQ